MFESQREMTEMESSQIEKNVKNWVFSQELLR